MVPSIQKEIEKMKKTLVAFLGIVVVASLLLAACQPAATQAPKEAPIEATKAVVAQPTQAETPVTSASKEPVLLTFSGPITGVDAADAVGAAKAYELAVSQANDAGGVCGGRKIETKVYDTKGDPKEGANVASMIANDQRVIVTVSDFNSAVTLVEGPIFAEAGLPQISYYASVPNLTLRASPILFRISPAGHTQAEFFANYIVKVLGLKKIAQIYANDEYSIPIKEVFSKAVKEYGGDIVVEEAVLPDQTDLSAVVSKIKAANPEAVALWVQYQVGAYYAKQAKGMGVTAPVFGFDGIFSPEYIKLGGDATEGNTTITAYVTTSDDSYVSSFVKAYRAKYNGEDPNNPGGYAYDATVTAISALNGSNCASRKAVVDWLMANTIEKPMKGVTGTITLDSNRDRIFSPDMYALVKVKDGKFVEVKP
jgi:branched-chain amino acid transport system substrate-binding protein